MDLDDVMRTTGAARSFTDQPVDDATLHRVLDAARFAPSGGNMQPWRVIVAKDAQVRADIVGLMVPVWREYIAQRMAGSRPFGLTDRGRWPGATIDLAEARAQPVPFPLVDTLHDGVAMLVLLVELRLLAAMDAELDRHGIIGGASIYPFAQNVLLAGRANGLGGVLTTFLARHETAARAVLGAPEGFGVAGVVFLGHVERHPTKLTRRPVESFTTVDRFTGPAFSPTA